MTLTEFYCCVTCLYTALFVCNCFLLTFTFHYCCHLLKCENKKPGNSLIHMDLRKCDEQAMLT